MRLVNSLILIIILTLAQGIESVEKNLTAEATGAGKEQEAFERAAEVTWQEVFSDAGTGN